MPAGYPESDQTNCQNVPINDGAGSSCTITNTATGTFIVHKDFSDDYNGTVTVSLFCGAGTVAPPTAPASEALPATFTVTGTAGSTPCTATESGAPVGYTGTGTCQATLSAGTCTIVNNAVANFQVSKDFSDNNAPALPCRSVAAAAQ